mmetsp:Transcript_22880/g.78296  ORF Transcript_22880/g.78296 Transcript_22880/m.78296 type:complete len:252 (+) Transcript_22880:613-1368(+)
MTLGRGHAVTRITGPTPTAPWAVMECTSRRGPRSATPTTEPGVTVRAAPSSCKAMEGTSRCKGQVRPPTTTDVGQDSSMNSTAVSIADCGSPKSRNAAGLACASVRWSLEKRGATTLDQLSLSKGAPGARLPKTKGDASVPGGSAPPSTDMHGSNSCSRPPPTTPPPSTLTSTLAPSRAAAASASSTKRFSNGCPTHRMTRSGASASAPRSNSKRESASSRATCARPGCDVLHVELHLGVTARLLTRPVNA